MPFHRHLVYYAGKTYWGHELRALTTLNNRTQTPVQRTTLASGLPVLMVTF